MNEPAVVDDTELLRLAAPRTEPLMPVLDRARAMWPLIVVFALLPITFATYYRTFDDGAAEWGLRAVDAVSAGDRGSFLLPGTSSARWAGPLSSWLEAAVLTGWWRRWPVAIVAVSVLATVFVGFAVHIALGRLAGPRFALWTTVLVCCHPVILAAGTSPAPRALGACVQMVAFGCLLRHRISLGRVVGIWNILTGVLLGLTLLASGPAYVVGVGTVTAYVVLRSVFGRHVGDEFTPVRRGTLRSLGALVVVVGTSLLVGGWWLVVAASEGGSAAIAGWLVLQSPTGHTFPVDALTVLARLVPLGGVMLGFAGLGAWRCASRIRDESDEPRRVSALLIAWFGVAILGWMIAAFRLVGHAEAMREWEINLVVPLLALAVVGIEAVRERIVGVLGTAGLAVLSLLAWVAWQSALPASGAWPVLLLFACVGLFAGAWRAARADDDWRRAFSTITLVGFVVLQVAIGFVGARRRTDDDRALQQFQSQLSAYPDADRIVFVGRGESATPPVMLAARVLWPGAPVSRARSRDEAVAIVLREVPAGAFAVLVDTEIGDTRPIDPAGDRFDVAVVSPRRLYRERRLRAHVLQRLPERRETATNESPLAE